MQSTPISVRGKKARQTSDASALRASSSSASKRQRATEPSVSFDQRLPLEVVEKIYLLSRNVNLALCSRRLHWMLSRRATRVEMALLAFSPAWDVDWAKMPLPAREADWMRHSSPASEQDDRYTVYSESVESYRSGDDEPGHPLFQTAVLECPWVDVPLLLDAEQLWMRRTFPQGGKNGGPVLAVPRKKHIVMRRPLEPISELGHEFRLFAQEADAIIQTHLERGCADHGHDYNLTPEGDEGDREQWEDGTSIPEEDSDWEDYEDGSWAGSPAAAAAQPATAATAPSTAAPTPTPTPTRLPSAHACFAFEALNATFRLSRWHEASLGVDINEDGGLDLSQDGPDREIRENAIRSMLSPLAPFKVEPRWVHPYTTIPERLLRADGAPVEDGDARLDAAALEACRARLQRTYELLLWLVVGGAPRMPERACKVTVEGTRRLLALAAADARTRPAGVLADAGATPDASPGAASAFPLRLSVDALCTSMLALFTQLGVYEHVWSEAVLHKQMEQMEDEDTLDEAFRRTKAYDYFMTIANEAAVARSHRQQFFGARYGQYTGQAGFGQGFGTSGGFNFNHWL